MEVLESGLVDRNLEHAMQDTPEWTYLVGKRTCLCLSSAAPWLALKILTSEMHEKYTFDSDVAERNA